LANCAPGSKCAINCMHATTPGDTTIVKKSDESRYQRQLELAGMSAAAQRKLGNATVVLFGLGGVGCACAAYLAEAGVGTLVLVDPAELSERDLPEQVLLTSADLGKSKVEAVKSSLLKLNPTTNISTYKERCDTHSAERFISDADVVVESISDWQEKLSASDACMHMGKTLIHAGVRAFEFQVYVMIPGKSSCLRCMFAETGIEDVVSPSDGPRGVLGPVAGMAGAFQAIEAIKLICGLGATPGSSLTKFDALRRYVDQIIELGPRAGCPDCGRRI
jgi:molybdopterin/thiamine biosynthesis adenylyltransferase